MVDGQVACVFLTTYTDPAIWGERGTEPAVYLHRIATHPGFRGRGFVAAIVEWAKEHARAKGLAYLRLDTWSDNERLKTLYESCGFRFLGVVKPADLSALPKHYSAIELGLFELGVS